MYISRHSFPSPLSNSDVERSAGLREYGPKALTIATELPEVGKAFIDFALSTTGPRMILRLRCALPFTKR